jgi:hypothetical protein
VLQAQGAASEYELKAAFLYKFAGFVEWPDPGAGPVCIGILGSDPFGGTLERVVKGKSLNGRPFVIRRSHGAAELSGCHIVFISSSEKSKFKSILGSVDGPILTVGDHPAFCPSGGMINLEIANDRIQLLINPEAAEKAHLRLSSKLLNLATIFHRREE